MDAKKRRGVGKSDALDARQIAAAALSLPLEKLRRARVNDGVRQALGNLITARDAMSTERTPWVTALTALLRTHVLGLDARKPLSGEQITDVSRWRSRQEELSLSIARAEAVRLAKRVLELDDQLKANEKQLTELVQISEAAPLLQEMGFGPSLRRPASPPGPTTDGLEMRPPTPPWPASTLSLLPQETPSATD